MNTGSILQQVLNPAGPQARHVSDFWWLTVALCVVVFLTILVALFVALRRAPRANAATPPDLASLTRPEDRARRLVSGALVASLLGLFVLIVGSFTTDQALAKLPLQQALHIEVVANQWWWDVRYDDPEPSRIFQTANELHIPVGRPVVVTLKSNDVIHSFWVPNLAGKKDLIPGREASLAFRADAPGVYRGQCAEFCGLQHANMAFVVVAQKPDEYASWAESQRQPAVEPAGGREARGREIFLSGPCMMCHAIQGTPANGRHAPDLTHLAGRSTIGAGSLPNDAAHLAAWISDPHKFKKGVNMPAIPLPQEDLDAMVAFLVSLK